MADDTTDLLAALLASVERARDDAARRRPPRATFAHGDLPGLSMVTGLEGTVVTCHRPHADQAIPEAVARQLALLRDAEHRDPIESAIQVIEDDSLGVRIHDGDELREELVSLAAAALYLLEVHRG